MTEPRCPDVQIPRGARSFFSNGTIRVPVLAALVNSARVFLLSKKKSQRPRNLRAAFWGCGCRGMARPATRRSVCESQDNFFGRFPREKSIFMGQKTRFL
jgi:hypothetical protein